MIRSDKDILAVLTSSMEACAIYDSADLHISYANTNMLKLWNCDQQAIGQHLEDCMRREELMPYIPLLKEAWHYGKEQDAKKVQIKLQSEIQPSLVYDYTFEYHPLLNEKGETCGVFQRMTLIPENNSMQPLTHEKNTIERKLLQDLLTQKQTIAASNYKIMKFHNNDTTSNKQTEDLNEKLKDALKKIIESEEHYHFALQSAEMGTWNLNCKNYIVHWDERTRELFGFAKGEYVPYNEVLKYIHSEDRHQIDQEVQKSLTNQNKGVYDVQFRTIGAEDHQLRWLHCKGRVYFDADQQPEWFAGTAIDVTAQHQEREKLEAINHLIAKRDQQFRMIVEAAGIGIFSIDVETNQMELNDRCRDLFGFEQNTKIKESDFFAQILPKYRNKIQQIFQEVTLKQSPFDCQCEIKDKKTGQVKWLRSIGGSQSESDTTRHMIYGAIIDNTSDKEEERKKLDFISIASHELKTPLTSLIAYIQLLIAKEESLSTEKRIQYLHQSNEQATRMRGLIDGFLNVTQLNEGKLLLRKKIFRVCSLMDYIQNMYSLKPARHFIHYTGDIHSSLEVMADRDKIEQVLINFMDNAIKYSPNNSTITMHVTVNEAYFQVEIKDQGKGIDSKDQKQIFDKFYRVNDDTQSYASGFGIGLFICKEIIQKHHGEIGVDSQRREGSTFWFKIPVNA